MRLAYRMAPLALMALVVVLSGCDTVTGRSEIHDLETRNAQLQGTIDVLGTPIMTIVALQQAATQNVLLEAQLSQAQNEALAAKATLTVLQLSDGIRTTPAPSIVVPGGEAGPVLTPGLTPGSAQTQFVNTVTATGHDSQDCPIGVSAVFDTTTTQIYVNTQINFIPAESTLGARWTANGALFYDDVQCWVPDRSYENICAWCSIVPDGPAFEAGNWTVELLLNGQLMSQAQFQVASSGITPAPTESGVTAP
ncbi:MAG TPA: hypothetical protein VMT24_08905 [Aggregatilineaceae bacterium]|nr:hypothetical protein [Aggregatilineaceae bacterium]